MNCFSRYKQLFQKDLEQYKDIELSKSIRVNTLKITSRKLLNRLSKKGVKLEKIAMLDNGYKVISTPFSLGSTPEHLMGYYYIQDAAAQMPSQLLAPRPGDIVLDMTAAPGGKLIQLAQYMNNQGVIIALDIKTQRIDSLVSNINRCGVTNTIVYNKDARYADDLNVTFDKVLLDAPCSGNFVSDKTWLDKSRTVEDFKENAKVQKQMLKAGISVLKENGILVYSTCTLEPEENEDVVEWAQNHLSVKLVQINRYFPPEFQGFFIAILRKVNI